MTMAADKQDKVLNVPTLRFPEFSGDWKESTIGKEFELYSGNTPSRLDKENFVGDVNWITSGELKDHYIGDTKEKISENSAKENNLRLLPEGTFVIAIYGLEAEGVRSTGSIITKQSTISQACMAFTPKGIISNEFLYSWYKKHGNVIGIRYAQGTKQQNLSYDIIEKFKIRYPSLQEQDKLNSFISLLDTRISTQSRIINELQSLISGITQRTSKHSSVRMVLLSELLVERNEKNTELFPVHSVSVSEGVINQIDYLGRSFSAADTSHYNVAHRGDIIYTKSPTGEFPFGIVKRNSVETNVSVSPLYGVYKPVSDEVALYIHYYFCSPLNAQNYLHKLIQKGAKNTINITNQRFLENIIPLPDRKTLTGFVKLISAVSAKLELEKSLLETLQTQKRYLLTQMFV